MRGESIGLGEYGAQGMVAPVNTFVDESGMLTPVSFRFLHSLFTCIIMLGGGGPIAVAALPDPTKHLGFRAMVTDAAAMTFGAIVTGGGSNYVPVYSDGTNWRIG